MNFHGLYTPLLSKIQQIVSIVFRNKPQSKVNSQCLNIPCCFPSFSLSISSFLARSPCLCICTCWPIRYTCPNLIVL